MSDVFPALVTVYPSAVVLGFDSPFSSIGLSDSGGSKFSECRVIVQKNRLIVGAETARGIQKIYEADVADVFSDRVFTRILTTSGDLVVYSRSKHCGCGSRLRSWNPYGGIARSSRD